MEIQIINQTPVFSGYKSLFVRPGHIYYKKNHANFHYFDKQQNNNKIVASDSPLPGK